MEQEPPTVCADLTGHYCYGLIRPVMFYEEVDCKLQVIVIDGQKLTTILNHLLPTPVTYALIVVMGSSYAVRIPANLFSYEFYDFFWSKHAHLHPVAWKQQIDLQGEWLLIRVLNFIESPGKKALIIFLPPF